MCLGQRLSDRSLARYKAKGKKTGYIKVWKCVDTTRYKRKKGYYPQWVNTNHKHKIGLNKASLKATDEQQLIHAFRNKKSAVEWNEGESSDSVVVECLICPDWVKAIGQDNDSVSLTTKAIVMPAYPKRKVTVKKFRAAIKGKKVKKYSWE